MPSLATSALAPLALLLAGTARAQYTATYTPDTAPATSEQGQTGTNQCGTGSSQDSNCQNAYINSVTDFCLWAPPSTTSEYGSSAIGNTEREVVAWCTQPGRGTRVIPEGAITGAHFVRTPEYIEIRGVGDLTKLNIPAGDDGGELDPHGADGLGNPIGGLVFSTAFSGNGDEQQVHEWTNFMSSNAFCLRACTGDRAAEYCQHIYDTLGCGWNMPGDYSAGSFDQCEGDAVEPMGVYSGSTFYQGDASTPAAHEAGATSACTPFSTIGGGVTGAVLLPTQGAVSDASSSAVPVSASVRSGSASASVASSTSVASSSAVPSSAFSSSAVSSSAASSSSSASSSVAQSSSSSSSSSASASASSSSSLRTSSTRSRSSSSASASASESGASGGANNSADGTSAGAHVALAPVLALVAGALGGAAFLL